MAEYKARRSHNALEIATELAKAMAYEAGKLEGEKGLRLKLETFLAFEESAGASSISILMLRKVLEV